MTFLVTGGHGYLGWPTALRLRTLVDSRVVIVDNGARARWARDVGDVTPGGRADVPMQARTAGLDGLDDVDVDLTDRDAVDRLLAAYEPDTVVHLAAQPSAPYSQLDGRRALETQRNNVSATLNLLWGLREAGLEDVHVVGATTTGIYGAPDFPIPEGAVAAASPGECGWIEELPFPNLGGSWYHVTKGFDAANYRRAAEWGQPISDVRTSIVYGASTRELDDLGLPTRVDVGYYFGTVVHRFCAQAVAGYPITVYGAGEQRKPFISLRDAVAGFVELALRSGPEAGVDVYNQVAAPVAIVDLAETVADVAGEAGYGTEVVHVENPREEDEEHAMEVENDRYRELIGSFEALEPGVRDVIDHLQGYEDQLEAATDRFLPAALLEEE